MNIAIDARTLVHSRSGVGIYTERIIRALLRIDPSNRYFVFLVEPCVTLEAPNLTKIMIEGYNRLILNRWWENIILPSECKRLSIDVYFSPAYALPLLPRLGPLMRFLPLPGSLKRIFNVRRRPKYVVTIHDVITSVLPETFTPKMRMWQFVFNSNAVRLADAIITDSESTRRDLFTHFGGRSKDVSVIHLSIDERYQPVTDKELLASVRARYDLPPTFILNVGTIEPRKNVGALARAYATLPEALRREYPLVLSGAVGWYGERILKEIEELGIGESIRILGFTDHAHLPALYSLATLFVYPSLYEGFGYPPLEAMACGTPVITSNRSSLPEVVGDGGIMVDPEDAHGLAAAMQRLLVDKEERRLWGRRGRERAARFTWHKTATQTLEVLVRAHGKPPHA